jgi:hypothetical protein
MRNPKWLSQQTNKLLEIAQLTAFSEIQRNKNKILK